METQVCAWAPAEAHLIRPLYPQVSPRSTCLISDWLKNSVALALLYSVSVLVLGLPLVWVFDPHGEGAVLAGLVLGACVVFVPTWVFLLLPRQLGMALFAAESLSPWLYLVHTPVPTRIMSGFVLWSLLELPMYGFELFGMLDHSGASIKPLWPRRFPKLLLPWFVALVVACSIGWIYKDATPVTHYPTRVWTVAYIFLPLAPLIAARQLVHRVRRDDSEAASAEGAPG